MADVVATSTTSDAAASAPAAPVASTPLPAASEQSTVADSAVLPVLPVAAEESTSDKAAAEAVPETTTVDTAVDVPSSSSTTWPALAEDHPLVKFLAELPSLLESTGHKEVYGITLNAKATDAAPDFHTLLILQKFLRANQNDLTRAKEQLSKTLAWRKEFDPIKASKEIFPKEKFAGLGYITVEAPKDGRPVPVVTTWNIYGAVKDYEKTFTPVEAFLRWRIGLMELGVSKLELAKATQPIPDYGQGPDPYQGIQVHDYKNVSFLRMDPRAKAASKATIQVLGDYYPETLSRKFFVNVPTLMQWMFTFSKAIISAETAKKFAVLSDGTYVAGELGENVPQEYGGTLGELSTVGESLKVE